MKSKTKDSPYMSQKDNTTTPETASAHNTPEAVSAKLDAIEKFVARRFDELSMEINATAQQVDMAEEGIIGRFAEVLKVIAAISHKGNGNTPANAGVELDAVVDMTESAAISIMDSAARIGATIKEDAKWETPEERAALKESIEKEVDEIFMACSFQDITGQRIRKTLENLQMIEDRLSSALEKIGIHINIDADENPKLPTDTAANQDDIDALFSGNKKV